MKVYSFHESDDWGMYQSYQILIDDKLVFSVQWNGDAPEDNTLYRNFVDVHSIPDLLRMAYDAGKRGEEFIVEAGT